MAGTVLEAESEVSLTFSATYSLGEEPTSTRSYTHEDTITSLTRTTKENDMVGREWIIERFNLE